MEEENEGPSQEEGRIQSKEPKRTFPSLLEVDLDELGLKNGEVLRIGEEAGQS